MNYRELIKGERVLPGDEYSGEACPGTISIEKLTNWIKIKYPDDEPYGDNWFIVRHLIVEGDY